MFDVIFDKQLIKKTVKILKNLWLIDWNTKDWHNHLEGRIIFLNKKFPNTPGPSDFRPICILSPIYKALESRFVEILSQEVTKNTLPCQLGFVRKMDTLTNIYRLYSFCLNAASQKKKIYALFIDYRNAYNTVDWLHLFSVLDKIFKEKPHYALFIKALYSHTTLRIGAHQVRPDTGLMQGSTLSPFLFDLCLDVILRTILNEAELTIDQILAYADDLLFLCFSLEQLDKTISKIEEHSPKMGLSINKSKSSIMEIYARKYARPKWYFKVGENYKGFPIVDEYSYLGVKINRILNLQETFKAVKTTINFTSLRLSALLSSVSVDFRLNSWNLFIRPLLEMISIPFIVSFKKTDQTKVRDFIKKTFKKFLNVGVSCEDKYLDLLKDYRWDERCKYLLNRCKIKWEARKKNQNPEIPRFEKHNEIDVKYLPGNFISLVKMFGCKCKYCGIYRVSPFHLATAHKINIKIFTIEQIYQIWKEKRNQWHKETKDRRVIIQNGEKLMKEFINEFKSHISLK